MKSTVALVILFSLSLAACGGADVGDPPDGGGPAVPLPDGPLGAGPYPVATLDVTITHPDAPDISYTVSCLGDTATVIGPVDVDERLACTALAADAVKDRLVNGAPLDQICTEIYGGPEVAHIVGTYDGVPVDTQIDRTNGCGIDDWDQLLAGILPHALGIVDPG